MARDCNSIVSAVIAHIPCKQGDIAVKQFLDHLKDKDGQLPKELKGGRQVFLGNPMPNADACKNKLFLEGLEAMYKHAPNLIWEFANDPKALKHVTDVVKMYPHINFVLDHLGLVGNSG